MSKLQAHKHPRNTRPLKDLLQCQSEEDSVSHLFLSKERNAAVCPGSI